MQKVVRKQIDVKMMFDKHMKKYLCLDVLSYTVYVDCIVEVKSYYSESLPFVTNQTIHHCDTAPSVMEDMAMELTAQQEWENEWNQVGLPSRLSEQVNIVKLKWSFFIVVWTCK